VLILDDEESLRMLLQEGLSARAFEWTVPRPPRKLSRTSGAPAMTLLLCDLHLSAGGYTVDGREAAKRILEAAGTQKPLLCT